MGTETFMHSIVETILGYSPIALWVMALVNMALLFTVNRLWSR